MSGDEIVGTILPRTYGLWVLQTHDVEIDAQGNPERGIVNYTASVGEKEQYSIYIEMESDETWGGAVLDISPPENPHRDALETYYGESVTDVLEKTREYMEKPITEWSPNW